MVVMIVMMVVIMMMRLLMINSVGAYIDLLSYILISVGYSYSLLTRNLAVLAKDLIQLLTICNQEVEPNLLHLADDFEAGLIIDGNEGMIGKNDDEDNEEDD